MEYGNKAASSPGVSGTVRAGEQKKGKQGETIGENGRAMKAAQRLIHARKKKVNHKNIFYDLLPQVLPK